MPYSPTSHLDEQRKTTIGISQTIELFQKFFKIVPVNSRELLDQVFRLRFQVYCLERSFESPADHPDGRERDDDDGRSSHFLVLYRGEKCRQATAVGTVRLVLPRRGAELPVFRLLPHHDRRRIGLPISSTAEVSRFAVPRSFRRQLERDLGDQGGDAAADSIARLALELLNFWLVRGVVRMTATSGITHIVAMMEPALLRLLRRLGIQFHPMGRMVQHHGLRQPVWAAMTNVTNGIRRCRPELWEVAFDAGWDVPRRRAVAYG